MKKVLTYITSIILAMFMAISTVQVVLGENQISLVVNNQPLPLEPQMVIIDSGGMIPARVVFEYLGFDIAYDPNQPAYFTAYRQTETSQFTIKVYLTGLTAENDHHIYVDYYEYSGPPETWESTNSYGISFGIVSDADPVIMNGHTFISARTLGEALGASVCWDADLHMVFIDNSNPVFVSRQVGNERSYTPVRYGTVQKNNTSISK